MWLCEVKMAALEIRSNTLKTASIPLTQILENSSFKVQLQDLD